MSGYWLGGQMDRAYANFRIPCAASGKAAARDGALRDEVF